MNKVKNLIVNLFLPCVLLSGIIGTIIGLVVFFYKLLWDKIFNLGLLTYENISNNLILIIPALIVIVIFAYIQTKSIKYIPESRGGGIPTSEGIVRGLLSCNPLLTLLFTSVLSFISIFIGVPLGSEGPSVMIGTNFSQFIAKLLPQKYRAYRRYLMTGGASTAFACATGAPITGVLFALEEIHRKFSPIILIVTISSIISGTFVAQNLCMAFNIPFKLFENISIPKISLNESLIFLVSGLIIGLFAVLFSKTIEFFKDLIDNKTKKINVFYKILLTFLITFILGFLLKDSLGGGHGLIKNLLNGKDYELYIFFFILIIKFLMVSFSSQSGVTGGMFIPILTIGAILGSLICHIFKLEEYMNLFIVASMVSFMGASIGCPLSALVFAVEVFEGLDFILPVAFSVFSSYLVFKLATATQVYDIVLERKLQNKFDYRIQKDSFACFKSTRDLLLPPNAIILNIQRKNKSYYKMDNLGDKVLYDGDIVTLQVQTYDIEKTKKDLEAFFGEQPDFSYSILQEKNYHD